MTIQMKANEQYFHVVLFIVLHKVVLILSLWMKPLSVTIQRKATEQYFPVILFIVLYKVVLTFEPVEEILQCDPSNENYSEVFNVLMIELKYFSKRNLII